MVYQFSFAKIKELIYQSHSLRYFTDTCKYADIILPATTSVEHDDIYNSYGHYTIGTGYTDVVAGKIISAYLQVSVKKRSCTTVNKSSRINPLRTTFWSGAVIAGFEEKISCAS